ncbi:helix-turn-helix domain-containing protein [Deinococcus marmoris]|uniref:Mobile element protein n=1 Tax=Deinococcus marmoris TaxID=249408 RepID=A0A1U7P4C7_9DEIO|nr:helix-turn-helix domain-containing protein [Deinococcus marmoris]OLV20008.1 Mobile element protein [Deinococcus marmoris]
MIRNKAFVVRLYPNAAQTELINRTLGCARFVYNHFLARRLETYRQDGKGLTYAATDKALTLLKRNRPLAKVRHI